VAGTKAIADLCRNLKEQVILLECGFAKEVLRCLRCGPFGGPYRFGIAAETTTNAAALDLAAFATNDGHVFLDVMEPIAPNAFEISLGS
jgi:hypothetical protein